MRSGEPEWNVTRQLEATAAGALKRMRKALSWQSVEAAASLLARAGRVLVYGTGGSSAILAQEAHNRLLRLGLVCAAHTDSYMQRMSATTLRESDVAVLISSSGRSRALLDSQELATYYGAICIGVAPKESSIGREVDICIDTGPPPQSIHPFHPDPMRYVQLYVIDCLAYAVALRLGSDAETSLKRMRASIASLHGVAPLQPIGD